MHLVVQIGLQLHAVLCQGNNTLGKGGNVDEVYRGDVLAHGRLGSIHYLLSLLLLSKNIHHACGDTTKGRMSNASTSTAVLHP